MTKDVLAEVLDEVRGAAAAGNALILGPGAVHNLQLAIESLRPAVEPTCSHPADGICPTCHQRLLAESAARNELPIEEPLGAPFK